MRILWIKTELLHPVDKGGKIRTYQMLRALARKHHVTYLCLDDGSADPDAAAKSSEYAQHLVTVPFNPPHKQTIGFFLDLAMNLFSALPYAIARYRSGRLREQVSLLAKDVDLVVCDFLSPAVNVAADLPTRSVLFQHNVEAMIWERHAAVPQNPIRRAYMTRQWQRMRRFEQRECQRFAHVEAVSDSDADNMRSAYGARSVASVATGVDIEFFAPLQHVPRRPREIVFVGSMDWLPNEDGIRWFIEACFPVIRQSLPDAHLTIVGRAPTAALRRLADSQEGIDVTGTVDDVRPYLAQASLSVVPLRIGGGTRLKIYESMAMGTPVVSTTIGAEGLPLINGEHLMLADDPQALATAIVSLLNDPATAQRIANNALHYVQRHCSWDAVADEFLSHCLE